MIPTKLLLFSALGMFSLVVASTASADQFLINDGFEAGSFAPGWTVDSASPAPFVTNTGTHSGGFGAFLGSPSGAETTGDSSIFSDLTAPLPAGALLSFWWSGVTIDTVTFDWQDAYVLSPTNAILATIMHVCMTTTGFQNVTFDLSPFQGQQIKIGFLVHGDAAGDWTSMIVDDVTIQAAVPEPGVTALGFVGASAVALSALLRRKRRATA